MTSTIARYRSIALTGVLLLTWPAFAMAQQVNSNLWVTDGAVNATAVVGNTLYLGGAFTGVGPITGGGAPLDAASGAPLVGFPKVHGRLYAVAADGGGGWFIGGVFDSVGGVPRSNIAYIRPNLTVAPWTSGASGPVWALAVSGGVVYAAGSFNSIGGQARNTIGAVDATTGLATSWDPNPIGSITALAVSGSTVYAGGSFALIGGQARSNIAALDATSGLATSWNPNANGVVGPLAVDGSTVYVGGFFTGIGGQTRNRLAALDGGTGLATSWNPNPDGNVNALVVSGTKVYVGGSFSTIGGQTRHYIAALDAASGLATAWDPNADNALENLAVSGSTVYACGFFTSVGGQSRNYLAAIDAATGLATSWDPNPNDEVRVVAASGSAVYAGGDFASIGRKKRQNVAALDVTTGIATSWNPNADNTVNALMASGSTVYVGGSFTTIGGQARFYLAALDATTGLATAWNPSANGYVNALAVSGSTVYVGGSFFMIASHARSYVAAIDAATGLATSWNPSADGYVQAIAVSGSTVYVGGSFTGIGGQARTNIAALDAGTGFATGWNPSANGLVAALAVGGSTVYAGGYFTSIAGQTRNSLAALAATTGLATSWNPDADGAVVALALSGSTVYAGGEFYNIGGKARTFTAALDATTGLASGKWNLNPSGTVYALAVSGSTVYVGGEFTTLGGVFREGIAAISALQGISQVLPNHGGNGGPISVVLLGVGFQGGATAKLMRSGQSDIVGTQVAVATGGDSLAVVFDLAGKAPGAWDVVVTNVDATSASYAGGFTIEAAAAPQLRVDVIGPALMRSSRRTAFDVVIENPGNVDATTVPLWLSGIPLGTSVEVDFPLAFPVQGVGEPNWSTVPLTFTSPGGQYTPILIPRIPPGATSRRIYLTVPNTVSSFKLRAAVTPPWNTNAFRACLSSGGVISSPGCTQLQLQTISNYLATHLEIGAMSGIGIWAKEAWFCEGSGTLPAALIKAEQILDYMVGPVENPGTESAVCSGVLPPRWRDSLLVTIVGSIDPNEKLGARDTLAVQQAIPYSIRFENKTSATAPAQVVVVSDPLSLATLDPATVSLDAITFGSIRIVPPPGLSSYATTVDLRPAKQLLVQVSGVVDKLTGVVSWNFTSIDPATGTVPADPLVGFLPPNLVPPEGEGSVLFTVTPRPGLAGGTQISNGASITFDDNAPLATGVWLNTVDNAAPTSHVMPLAPTSDQSPLTVSWITDGAPPQDLRDYTVYVSEDGAPYRVWRLNTKSVADTLMPPGNHVPHTYAFYSVARDLSGNIEAAPQGPDATTLARTSVGDGGALELALMGARPNPAREALTVWFTLPSRERATLDVMDIAGRRVLRHEVGSMGPGTHAVRLGGAPTLRPGLYFLRLNQGTRELNARAVVIQ